MDKDIDVSAVITMHAEELLAHTTLRSVERCRNHAERNGLIVEFVIILDDSSEETRRVVTEHPDLRSIDQVHEVSFRDLSACINFAVEHARGRYIGTFDGDDYWSENWITRCVESIIDEGESRIYHPEITIAFGSWNAYWWQVDQLGDDYREGTLLTMDYWGACAFAAKEVFVQYPYQVSRVGEAGFGYEGWHWNCETIEEGYVHRPALGTARFERHNEGGTLNVAHQRTGAVIRPTKLFDRG